MMTITNDKKEKNTYNMGGKKSKILYYNEMDIVDENSQQAIINMDDEKYD